MSGKHTETFSDEAHLEAMITLLGNGYTDEVKALTMSIQLNPAKVLGFEAIYDLLNREGVIDWVGTPSQEAAMLDMTTRSRELESFLDGLSRPSQTYVHVINHGHEVTFEIGWHDQMAGEVVWDHWTAEVDDPVIAFADIGFLFDAKDYRCTSKPTAKSEPPLYRYHPERFKAYRDYAEPVGKFYRQKVDPVSGMMTVDQVNEVMHFVCTELNQRSLRFPRKLKASHPSLSLVMEAEDTLATAYGRFVQAGRQIMDFPPGLTEMLAKTDIDDIPLDSIKLPYASQYLHFGPQAELEIEPGWWVDGAYVEQRGAAGDVRFTITAIPTNHSFSERWYLFPEPEYTQDFVGDFRSMDLGTAIDTVLSDYLADLRVQQAKPGGDITTTVQVVLAEHGEALPDAQRIVDAGPTMAALRDDITRRRHPVYRAALQLVVNALCYVAAYPDDIDTVCPEGTPESLKQKLLHGKGKEQMRAKSKLAALGYVPVHICGKRIAEQRAVLGIRSSDPGRVATHWRRGHWRNQVHGPARSLRKLIWVMPVIVGSKHEDGPEDGHVYLVS
jgi:hypothetical protein